MLDKVAHQLSNGEWWVDNLVDLPSVALSTGTSLSLADTCLLSITLNCWEGSLHKKKWFSQKNIYPL